MGAYCADSASLIVFNIIYIMRTEIGVARLCGFDQNSVNHPGILLMAHSARFFTLDEVNPCCRPAPDNADGRAAPRYQAQNLLARSMPCSSTTKRPKIMRSASGWSRRRISLLSERQNDVGLAGFSHGGNHVVSQNL